jgi:hypothetical protein
MSSASPTDPPLVPPSNTHQAKSDAALSPAMTEALRIAVLTILAACLAAVTVIQLAGTSEYIPFDYFARQDAWWLMAISAFCIACRNPHIELLFRAVIRTFNAYPSRNLLGLGLLLLAVMWSGTYFIHHDYNRTLDEVMARFDARIFGRGRFFASIPELWQPYAKAMMPAFDLPVAGRVAWVSAYLPGNAAFQALVGTLLPQQLANPLLSALALALTWSTARVLWPERRDPAVVTLLLMLTSTQLLFMAMTSWAMAGHLALTMLWLRLYLRQDAVGHAGCIATGLIACGWHQLAFHALFVAPFVLNFWWKRRWSLALIYSATYVLIGLFWISYGQLAASASGISLQSDAQSGLRNFTSAVLTLVDTLSISSVVIMLFNIMRFVAWQNPILLPLLMVAWRMSHRLPEVLRLAIMGLALTLFVVLIVLPYQGHGWGYRYVHAYIGVLCLIAAHAWMHELAPVPSHPHAGWMPLAAAVAFVLLVQLPGQAWQVHAQVAPRAVASAAIARANADIVIIDPRGLFNPGDLVRNDPFLAAGKPIVMDMYEMTPARIAGLCARAAKVTVFEHTNAAAAGARTSIQAAPHLLVQLQKSDAALRALACFVPWLAAASAR